MHFDRRSRFLQLRPRTATAAVLLAATVLSATLAIEAARAGDAGASCAAPSVMFAPSTAAAGQKIFVTGRGWGDDCLDVNPPPTGQLGDPIEGIEVVLVQGDREWVLTSVDADDDYEFSADVTVPSETAVGTAQLEVRQAIHGVIEPQPSPDVTITEPPPGATLPAPTDDSATDPGESDDEMTTAADGSDDTDDSSFPVVPVAIAAGVLLALVVVFVLRRSSSTR